MIQLYYKGEWSNSCSEVPDGTMITVQSNTYEAKYSALKAMGVSHGAASFAANSKWETAQEKDKRMSQQTAPKNDKNKNNETSTTSSDNTLDKMLDNNPFTFFHCTSSSDSPTYEVLPLDSCVYIDIKLYEKFRK